MPFFSNIQDMENWAKRFERVTPFWFILDRGEPYGPHNLGVSSYSILLACEVLDRHADVLRSFTARILDGQGLLVPTCVADIDLSLLDTIRVRPHIGRPYVEGVWWPNLQGKDAEE
jgi:hypothetical protein